MYNGPVYSPSQTERFIRCPALWDYSRRWEQGDRGWLAQLIGKSIHYGAMTFYKGLQFPVNSLDPVAQALDFLVKGWPEDGGGVEDTIESAALLVKKGLAKALSINFLPHDEDTMLAVEHPMSIGACFSALVIRHATPSPWIEIIDWKYGHSVSDWLIQKRLDEAQTSWQLKHYGWRVGTLYPDIPVKQATMVLLVGTPRCVVKTAKVEISEESTALWFTSAQSYWEAIQAWF